MFIFPRGLLSYFPPPEVLDADLCSKLLLPPLLLFLANLY